jgi:hypothetical protein
MHLPVRSMSRRSISGTIPRGNRNYCDRVHIRSVQPVLAIASSLLIYAPRSLFSRLGLVTWRWPYSIKSAQKMEGANEFHVELCTIMVFCRPNQVIGRRDSCSCRPERSDRPEE